MKRLLLFAGNILYSFENANWQCLAVIGRVACTKSTPLGLFIDKLQAYCLLTASMRSTRSVLKAGNIPGQRRTIYRKQEISQQRCSAA